MKNLLIILLSFSFASCGGFQAKRVNAQESDEKALGITDEWVSKDSENVVKDVLRQMETHNGYARYKRKNRRPKVFIGEIQNLTSEAYFPINDINDEFLNELSRSGDFVLIDAAARESILKEIKYQNDGMVDPNTAKKIGKQTGADLMIFGNVYMKPASRKGKTIKEYAINIRMTDIEKGEEVLRTRAKLYKYSKKSKVGW